MVHHERQDELLDQPEHAEIFMRADMVEGQLLRVATAKSSESVRARFSGMNGFEKSSAASGPMTSSICHAARFDAARIAGY